MDLSTRRVEIGGIAGSANGLWMVQIARNLTDAVEGFLCDKRYLIHDRNPLYTKEFLRIIAASGIEAIKLPPRPPKGTKAELGANPPVGIASPSQNVVATGLLN